MHGVSMVDQHKLGFLSTDAVVNVCYQSITEDTYSCRGREGDLLSDCGRHFRSCTNYGVLRTLLHVAYLTFVFGVAYFVIPGSFMDTIHPNESIQFQTFLVMKNMREVQLQTIEFPEELVSSKEEE